MRTFREGRATAAEKEPVMPSDDDERHDDAEHEHEQTSEPVGELEVECWMLHEHRKRRLLRRAKNLLPATCLGADSSAKFWTKK